MSQITAPLTIINRSILENMFRIPKDKTLDYSKEGGILLGNPE